MIWQPKPPFPFCWFLLSWKTHGSNEHAVIRLGDELIIWTCCIWADTHQKHTGIWWGLKYFVCFPQGSNSKPQGAFTPALFSSAEWNLSVFHRLEQLWMRPSYWGALLEVEGSSGLRPGFRSSLGRFPNTLWCSLYVVKRGVSTPIKFRICHVMDQHNLHLLIIAVTYQAKIIEALLKAISGKQCVAIRHSEKTCCLQLAPKEVGALMEHVPW